MNLAEQCVYTIVSRDILDEYAHDQAPLTRAERKSWKTAKRLLDEATSKSLHLPIVLADAKDCSRLLYWGLLVDLKFIGGDTSYTVDRLRPFRGEHVTQELVLLSTKKTIAPRFIRPYALCVTPQFLDDSPEDFNTAAFVSPEEGPSSDLLVEGKTVRVTVNAYERNPEARRRCIAHFGCRCLVCGLQFSERYQGLGDGFIHVHHVAPISKAKNERAVDPIRDLRPVCPNCHAMLHSEAPPLTVEALRARLRS